MKKIIVFMLILAVSLATVYAQGVEEKFPNRSITIVCQANPGGSSSLNCQTIAPGMEKVLSVPVTVDHRPGAGGGIAMDYVAASPADGYTIAHLPVDITQVNAAGNAESTPASFRFLARTSTHPAAIAVKADSQWKTIEQYIAYAKANPGKISVGNSGYGAIWHLAAVQFEQAIGATLNHIPFEGAAPAITSMLGGHIDSICASAAEVRSYVQSGEFRLLAVMDDKRFALFPEVPTLKDVGVDLSVLCWLAFGVPKNTPDAVFNTLLDAMRTSYNSEAYQAMLASNGYTPGWQEPAEITAFAEKEYQLYKNLIPRVLSLK